MSKNVKEKKKEQRVPVDEISFWMDYDLPNLYVSVFKSPKDHQLIICINKTPDKGRPKRLSEDFVELMAEFEIPRLIETGAKEIIHV